MEARKPPTANRDVWKRSSNTAQLLLQTRLDRSVSAVANANMMIIIPAKRTSRGPLDWEANWWRDIRTHPLYLLGGTYGTQVPGTFQKEQQRDKDLWYLDTSCGHCNSRQAQDMHRKGLSLTRAIKGVLSTEEPRYHPTFLGTADTAVCSTCLKLQPAEILLGCGYRTGVTNDFSLRGTPLHRRIDQCDQTFILPSTAIPYLPRCLGPRYLGKASLGFGPPRTCANLTAFRLRLEAWSSSPEADGANSPPWVHWWHDLIR